MLPRVSSALAQHISPISTASTSHQQASNQNAHSKPKQQESPSEEKAPQEEPRQQQGQPPESPQTPQAHSGAPPGATIIPFPSKKGEVQYDASGFPIVNAQVEERPRIPPGITLALIEFVHLLQKQRTTLLGWLGATVYKTAPRLQKKGGRVRKGMMLDEDAH
ncbi:hypothetical protein WDW37_04415 [Bdellovibrionota bacterium FG-1]